MQENFQSRSEERGEWLEVTDPKAVKFLKDPERYKLLEPFMREPRCLSQVAQQRGVALSQLYYDVQKLLRWGLLEVTHREARKGRAVKFYAAAAPAFFVSYEHLESPLDLFMESELASLHKLTTAVNHSFRQLIQGDLRSDEWGRLYQLDARGAFNWFSNSRQLRFKDVEDYARYLSSEEAIPYLRTSFEVHLSRADAKAFQRDLIALRRRYHAEAEPPGQSATTPGADQKRAYQVRICLAEMPE